ncbi:MAG TPA: hypothetical protein VE733_00970 [Streptosporangiaceae bacterium]|nr:hypothetical protein [Streptosporangiaceae bacterium]
MTCSSGPAGHWTDVLSKEAADVGGLLTNGVVPVSRWGQNGVPRLCLLAAPVEFVRADQAVFDHDALQCGQPVFVVLPAALLHRRRGLPFTDGRDELLLERLPRVFDAGDR